MQSTSILWYWAITFPTCTFISFHAIPVRPASSGDCASRIGPTRRQAVLRRLLHSVNGFEFGSEGNDGTPYALGNDPRYRPLYLADPCFPVAVGAPRVCETA